jgi:predicted ester cyclase
MREETTMMFVERFASIFEGARLELVDELFAPEFVGHLPPAPILDRSGWKTYVGSFIAAVSDLVQEINEVLIAEDRLLLRVTYFGRHSGALFGVPATGFPVTVDAIGIFRFDPSGLVAECWAMADLIGLLAQMRAARARQRLSRRE